MAYKLLISRIYQGYKPFTNHLLTSWDIQVHGIRDDKPKMCRGMIPSPLRPEFGDWVFSPDLSPRKKWRFFWAGGRYLEDHPTTCKWLVTPIYKPIRPFGRGITLLRGLTNHGY